MFRVESKYLLDKIGGKIYNRLSLDVSVVRINA